APTSPTDAVRWRRAVEGAPTRGRNRISAAAPPPSAARARRRVRLSCALLPWNVVSLRRSCVDLPWPGDLLLRVEQHLFPLCDPARGPRNREQHREHLDRKAHRLVDQARVEVDVRVELAGDEVVVLQRDALELESDFEKRVLAGDGEDEIGDFLDHFGARVVRLVDAVAEP